MDQVKVVEDSLKKIFTWSILEYLDPFVNTKINLNMRRFCTFWYHLYNSENVKNTYGGVLLLVKLQAKTCNFTKSNTPPWLFFTFLKIVQVVPNGTTHHIFLKNLDGFESE